MYAIKNYYYLFYLGPVSSWPSRFDHHHRYHHHSCDEDWHDHDHDFSHHGHEKDLDEEHPFKPKYDILENDFHEDHPFKPKHESHQNDFNSKDFDYTGLFDLDPAASERIMTRVPPKGKFSNERGIVTSGQRLPSSCRCIDVKKCPAVMEQIQWRPIDDDLRRRLRSAACGFRGFEPQVSIMLIEN